MNIKITNSGDKHFDRIMNDWLWNERDYNPFLKYMAELGRSLPEVNNVKQQIIPRSPKVDVTESKKITE